MMKDKQKKFKKSEISRAKNKPYSQNFETKTKHLRKTAEASQTLVSALQNQEYDS